jgi:hypothetical protein
VQEAITLFTLWFGGGFPIGGVTHLHFYEKGVKAEA